MLRITEKIKNTGGVTLRLDGAVSGDAADDLWQLCARHRIEGAGKLVIDMVGVNFMSTEAARKLAAMRGESLRVINCSPFIATLLDTADDVD
jgi:anti-anti-sigma regulatory factor